MMEYNYDKLTKEKVDEIVKDIWDSSWELKREMVLWCVDEADGVFKDYKETAQFDRAMKKYVNETFKNEK